MRTELTTEAEPYTVPDVPYVIGICGNVPHAVTHERAVWAAEHNIKSGPVPRVYSECGSVVFVARRWGEFRRGNEYLATHQLCPHCAWTVALAQGRIEEELAAIAPTANEEPTWLRLLPDPTLFIRICARILDDRQQENEYDADHPRWAQLLGHVTAHRPVVLVAEECTEGGCEHEEDQVECPASLACQACSVQAGPWAGEWEDMYEVTVPAPCSVLTAMAAQFGVSQVSTVNVADLEG